MVRAAKVIALCGMIWLAPIGIIAAILGPTSVQAAPGLFFAKMALVTFVPSFLLIFLGGPYIEGLRGRGTLTGALSAITAAVVGVILNLAAWFVLRTPFADVGVLRLWAVAVGWPVWSSLDPWAVGLALVSFVALFRFDLGMLPTLALCGALGWLVRMLP